MPAFTITADQIADVVPVFYNAKHTPLFVGRPGIAKTAMIREGARLLGNQIGEEVFVRELHLASMSEVDVRGYLVPDGQNAVFTKPEYWGEVLAHKRGILFLDEFVQATHEVQKAVAPLILERRIGEFYLPEGWTVMCAGNGLEDGAGANSLLSHVLNRLTYINVTAPDVDNWVGWAVSEGLPPELIAFAKLRPNIVFECEIPSAPDTPYCTPRSLDKLGKLAHQYPGGIRRMVEEKVGMAIMCGQIGDGPTSELSALVRTTINLPTYEEVVSNPDGTRLPTEASESYAMVMLCAVRAKTEHREQVATYLCRFQPNIALTGIVAMVRRDKSMMQSARMLQWVRDNKELLGKFKNYITEAV
jgi:dynein-related subfamily AAA family protein